MTKLAGDWLKQNRHRRWGNNNRQYCFVRATLLAFGYYNFPKYSGFLNIGDALRVGYISGTVFLYSRSRVKIFVWHSGYVALMVAGAIQISERVNKIDYKVLKEKLLAHLPGRGTYDG